MVITIEPKVLLQPQIDESFLGLSPRIVALMTTVGAIASRLIHAQIPFAVANVLCRLAKRTWCAMYLVSIQEWMRFKMSR